MDVSTSPQENGEVGSRSEHRETVYLLRREHPQIALTWSSRFPRQVDKLKLRKKLCFWPVVVTLKADYDTNRREFEYGCSAKDSILGGRISVNLPEQQLEYRKKFHLPNGGQLAFTGSCMLQQQRLHPNFGVQLEFGSHSSMPGLPGRANAVWTTDGFDVRHRFSVARGLSMEIAGNASFPAPAARYSHDSGTLALGEGSFHFHVAEVNAVLKI